MSGPCCVRLGAKVDYQPRGTIEEIAGFQTYRIGQGKSNVIVFFTDVFGYSFVNAQRLADCFHDETGATVLIPDYFQNDPIDPKTEDLFAILPVWLNKHPPTEACRIGQQFISTIQQQYQIIQIIGFCYGAKVVVDLIKHEELSSRITAAVVAHPSFLVKDEAKEIQRPILFLCAESDSIFTNDIKEVFQRELTSNGLGEFIDFAGTTHGFVVRPSDDEHVLQQRDQAVQQAIQFFQKYFSS